MQVENSFACGVCNRRSNITPNFSRYGVLVAREFKSLMGGTVIFPLIFQFLIFAEIVLDMDELDTDELILN